MDPISPYTGPDVPHYVQMPTTHGGNRGSMVVHKRFEKSESEDSGVELPPASPFGSESSYNLDESESLESSTPEYSENLDSPTSEDPGSPKKTTIEKQGSLEDLEETLLLEHSTRRKAGSFKMHPDNDTDAMECSFTQPRERGVSGVPHKLEQAILRTRRQRSTSRESIQSRTTRYSRQYVGSLKDQCRGKAFSYQTRIPTRQCQENKEQDPLLLPGDGIRYLESLCQMLEQIAELQQKNQRLHQEKREAEGRLNNQVLFLDACVCGASRASRDMDNDLTDNPHPKERTWEPTHYRKRSSSHAGMLLSMARPTDNGLREEDKTAPQYVSVPNLKQEKAQRPQRNCKPEASQWYKVKDMLSRLARRGAGPLHGDRQTVEPPNSCRTQTFLEGNPQHPKRLFLPGLVIRPRNHGRHLD